MFRLYLYARVRFLRTLHTRPRVQRAPGIPCALCLLRVTRTRRPARAHGAARTRNCIQPSLREAKRRSNPIFLFASKADCLASLAMTWIGRGVLDIPLSRGMTIDASIELGLQLNLFHRRKTGYACTASPRTTARLPTATLPPRRLARSRRMPRRLRSFQWRMACG